MPESKTLTFVDYFLSFLYLFAVRTCTEHSLSGHSFHVARVAEQWVIFYYLLFFLFY